MSEQGVFYVVKDREGYVREVDGWFMATPHQRYATRYTDKEKAIDVATRRSTYFAKVVPVRKKSLSTTK